MRKKNKDIKYLYHITHIDNILPILSSGIFSHNLLNNEKPEHKILYNKEIVELRKEKRVLSNSDKTLWDYANLYFQPRNPMLYTLKVNNNTNNIVILALDPTLINKDGVIITDGNAANSPTKFYSEEKKEVLKEIEDVINLEWWTEHDGTKRKIMAECLVPSKIEPKYIKSIYVKNHEIKEDLEKKLSDSSPEVIVDPSLFFEATTKFKLEGSNISIAQGDMFFSDMQTMTISVNTVGVMGAGLASRTRYQFPDVFVKYQDLCKTKKMTVERPRLYKRQTSFDSELSDANALLKEPNNTTWFLLFATKKHWKEDSKIEYIESGMKYLSENYKEAGIKSIALPALGCGLGKLSWEEVGKVMCKYLKTMDIESCVYLPNEKRIKPEFLTKEFLLS